MINAITSWVFGDIEHLDPAEAYALTITKQDMICIAKAVLVAINLNHNTEKETTPWEYSACSPSSE